MRYPLPEKQRAQLKAQWAEFTDQLLKQTGWTMQDLANRVGCSVGTVSRWKSPDTRIGTLPTKAAAKVLHEIARRERLV